MQYQEIKLIKIQLVMPEFRKEHYLKKKKEDFYQNIKKELDVPEYFGNNLDALYDFLTEQPDILQMKFLHYNMMQSQLGRSFCQQLLKVLQDADILTIIEEY